MTSFTRIDERWTGRKNRYIFVQYADPSKPFAAKLPNDPRAQPNNCIARFDDMLAGGTTGGGAGSGDGRTKSSGRTTGLRMRTPSGAV